MSESINPHFLVYAITTSNVHELRVLVKEALGCELQPAERDSVQSQAFSDDEAIVFGMNISVRWIYKWPHGNVYRISGGTLSRHWDANAIEYSIDEYAMRLLRGSGIKSVLTREEFSALRRRIENGEGG